MLFRRVHAPRSKAKKSATRQASATKPARTCRNCRASDGFGAGGRVIRRRQGGQASLSSSSVTHSRQNVPPTVRAPCRRLAQRMKQAARMAQADAGARRRERLACREPSFMFHPRWERPPELVRILFGRRAWLVRADASGRGGLLHRAAASGANRRINLGKDFACAARSLHERQVNACSRRANARPAPSARAPVPTQPTPDPRPRKSRRP